MNSYDGICKDRVDLRHIAIAVAESVGDSLRRRNQQFDVHVASDILVMANGYWLARAISCLIRNASNCSARGLPIALTMEGVHGTAEIRVRNQGPDLSPHRFRSVFDPDQNPAADDVGVAVARKIIEMHKGTLWVQPLGSGLGSVYVIRLPAEINSMYQVGAVANSQN